MKKVANRFRKRRGLTLFPAEGRRKPLEKTRACPSLYAKIRDRAFDS
ncbi:hypothetical protein RYH73_07990 [Olivibacter sp. CPCC 100613]|nr:hypothetical protein [Olivibacter sp. 47]MDM8173158.1 hypothetical protein [Olivibacter sp. 47]MDX3915394.1 hypothetical protein [Pseudosphingobacterium sp.]